MSLNEKIGYSIGNSGLPVLRAEDRKRGKSLNGVEKESVQVLFNSSKVKFDFDDEKLSVEDVEKAITALGYEVLKSQVK